MSKQIKNNECIWDASRQSLVVPAQGSKEHPETGGRDSLVLARPVSSFLAPLTGPGEDCGLKQPIRDTQHAVASSR